MGRKSSIGLSILGIKTTEVSLTPIRHVSSIEERFHDINDLFTHDLPTPLIKTSRKTIRPGCLD
jgi:hypothetical protein